MNDPYQIAASMTCPNCGAGVHYGSNAEIYHRPFGSGVAYICNNFPACDSFVGAHGDNANEEHRYKPFGSLADGELRSMRKRVHSLIDVYWQTPNVMSRKTVYYLLADLLELPIEETHVGMFDKDTCQRVLDRWETSLPDKFKNLFLDVPKIIPDREG